jgi:ferric-dicitrate binding protein FerR (iron transport regulator)
MFENLKIKKQIVRFLTGECSEEEGRVISGLIETDERYRSIHKQLQKTWHTAKPAADETYNVDDAWLNVLNRIETQNEPVVRTIHHHKVRRIVYAVASAAAVLLIGLGIFNFLKPSDNLKTFCSDTKIAAPFKLSDGSVIHLSKNSVIKYPEKFGQNSREVYFWGEAFFAIASDKTRPFVIEAGETRIKVLGTSFNVRASEETGRVEVTVNSGSVLFYYVDESETALDQVTLTAGDRGVYNRKTGKITKSVNTDLNFLGWKTGILVFDEAPLADVLETLGSRYDVSFNVTDKQIENLRLTATFDNESLDSILQVIQLVHSVKISKTGKDYLVTK